MARFFGATLRLIVNGKWLIVSLLFLFTIFSLFLTNDALAATTCGRGSSAEQIRSCRVEKDVGSIVNGLATLINGDSEHQGALYGVGQLITLLYAVPPASGVQYVAGQIQQFNPLAPAYAQDLEAGIGFEALRPAQGLWRAFRNLSYVGFVIVFVIIGFMVMFRAHISPQAVATIQDSLPRIVIALVLVTFSYAIAGLMIDIMFVALNIAVNFLASQGLIEYEGAQEVLTNNVFSLATGAFIDVFKGVAGGVSTIIHDLITLPDILSNLFGGIVGGVAGLIAGIALLFVAFRVFLMLLMSYVTIIMLTIFAPFFFLIQALPGNAGAKTWFKQMAANVSVFATVAIMFILGAIIGGIKAFGGSGDPAINGQAIGQFPLLAGGLTAEAISSLVGFGILLLTPTAAKIIKDFLGVKEQGYGQAAMGALGAGAAPVAAFGRGAFGAAVTRGPFGAMRREWEARRGETAQIKARARIYEKPPRGLSGQDVERFGVGYPKKP